MGNLVRQKLCFVLRHGNNDRNVYPATMLFLGFEKVVGRTLEPTSVAGKHFQCLGAILVPPSSRKRTGRSAVEE